MAYDQTAADTLRELGQLRARIDGVLADLDTAYPPGQTGVRTHYPGCWANKRHGDCLAARMRRILRGEYVVADLLAGEGER